jgi:hypothetical protein
MVMCEEVAASTNGERELEIDRLTRIDGIARKTAEAVYEIGVHSYADLARYSSQHTAQQISVALREHGVRRPPTFIDPVTWARQARAFSELEHDVSLTPGGEERAEPDSQVRDGAPSLSVPSDAGDVRIEVEDVHVSVLWPNAHRPRKKLKAEVRFRLAGNGARALAARGVPFRIEGYTVKSESGISERVTSEQSQLVPEVFEYVGKQEFAIPDLGQYDFHSIVLLLPPGQTAAYRRGPTVQVVP